MHMFACTICPDCRENIVSSQYLRSFKTVTQETSSVIFVRKGGGAEILKEQSDLDWFPEEVSQ